MKKILLAALAALCLTTPAWANIPAGPVHNDVAQLHFVAHVAANSPSVWDSITTQRVGAQICVLDTSAAVSTKGWFSTECTAAGDSTQFCQLFVFDATGSACESGADSLYIATQVSADGITWVTPGTFVGGTLPTIVNRLDQTNVAGGFRGCLTLNGAALSLGAPTWQVRYFTKDLAGAQGLEDCSLRLWPYIRWIIGFPDVKGYKVQAKVSFFTTSD